jgi:hypothetical protein
LFVVSIILVLLIPFLVFGAHEVSANPSSGPGGGKGGKGGNGGNANNHIGQRSILVLHDVVIVSVIVFSPVTITIPVVHVITHFEPPDPCVNSCSSTVSPTSFGAGFFGLVFSAVGMLGIAGYLTIGAGYAAKSSGHQTIASATGGAGAGKAIVSDTVGSSGRYETHSPGHRTLEARKGSNEFDSVTGGAGSGIAIVSDTIGSATSGAGAGKATHSPGHRFDLGNNPPSDGPGGGAGNAGGGSAVAILQQLQQMLGGGGNGTGESAQSLIQQLMGMVGGAGTTGGGSAAALLQQLQQMMGGGTGTGSGASGETAQGLIQQLMGMMGGGTGTTGGGSASTGSVGNNPPGMSYNLGYLNQQSNMQNQSRSYTAISNIMKTKWDTLKNMLENLR